jgi:ectoine hydroxylase-related dioxygenase (phytanoyl-CoA dioxygenase family)
MTLSSEPLRSVNADEIAAYDRDGVVCLQAIFPTDWIEKMAAAVDDAMADPGPFAEEYAAPGGGGRFFGDLNVWRRHDAFRDFVFQSPAARIAAQIMAARKVNFFYDQLLVKEPGTAERTPWHQDQPYWAVAGRDVMSIWLPFDPVAKAASVEYILGSHHWPAYNPQHFSDASPYEGTDLPPLPDIEGRRADYSIASFDLEPGDCLAFQAMIVHGAPGNDGTRRRRRALATRWTGDDARYDPRAGEIGIPTEDPGLVAGADMDCDAFPVVWRAP